MGSLVVEPVTSPYSQTGDVADEASEEVELGNLECPRSEKVGVGGVELSEVQYEEAEVEIERADLRAASSPWVNERVLPATIAGRWRGLRSRIVVDIGGEDVVCRSHYLLMAGEHKRAGWETLVGDGVWGDGRLCCIKNSSGNWRGQFRRIWWHETAVAASRRRSQRVLSLSRDESGLGKCLRTDGT